MAEATVRLLFIRHGDAGDPGEWIGPDVERPLTDRGVKQISRLAAGLLAARTKIDAVRTSPARRCGETAAIIAAALDIVPSADALLAEGLELNDLTKLVPKRATATRCGS
ncbi:MAG: SixA phosphatase family protein [Candidatus Limnocylindrus sp.]